MSHQPIVDSLERTYELFGQLLDLLVDKKEFVVQDKLTELTHALSKESRLLKRIAEEERTRAEAVKAYQFTIKHFSREPLTLAGVAQTLTSFADKSAVLEWMEKLTSRAEEIRKLNETNQMLVQQALDFANLSVDLLVGVQDEAVYQDPTAQTTYTPNRPGLYDFRA
ncbi:flagellar protein FlgN [Cohnella fermenti]|uniref:flagellar protein FlgN n=1 Tax=Cohnella fermenti TaxID=2565925 RepID=UPI001454DFBB|nr:flagellar protein FlgN [Cohnella fermenti]